MSKYQNLFVNYNNSKNSFIAEKNYLEIEFNEVVIPKHLSPEEYQRCKKILELSDNFENIKRIIQK